MYYTGSYTFPRKIIDGNRVTIPKDVMVAKGWKVGDQILVKFESIKSPIKGIVI